MGPSEVYTNAWSAIKSLVQRCYSHGIGVLIDMHALPGGANTDIHSGTSHGKAALWNDSYNLEIAYKCFQFLATQLVTDATLVGVIGVQLANEAARGSPGLYDFYDHAIADISAISPTIPIYVSDAWDLQRALTWAKRKNSVARDSSTNPIIVDTHKHYTFSQKDTSCAPQDLNAQIDKALNEALDDALPGTIFDKKGAVAIFVGECSCALSYLSCGKFHPSERPALTEEFGIVQTKRWRERSCGSAFWTFKLEGADKPDWRFTAQVGFGAILSLPEHRLKKEDVLQKLNIANHARTKMMMQAMQAQSTYWDNTAPGARFEHWRYADGWHLGWGDARDFYRARSEGQLGSCEQGADAIGMVELWILHRMKEEHFSVKEKCEFGWEWEVGFRKGLLDFETSVGLS